MEKGLEKSHSMTTPQGGRSSKDNSGNTHSFCLQGQGGRQVWQNSTNPPSSTFSSPPIPGKKKKKKRFLTQFFLKFSFKFWEEIERRELLWGHTSCSLPSPDTCASRDNNFQSSLAQEDLKDAYETTPILLHTAHTAKWRGCYLQYFSKSCCPTSMGVTCLPIYTHILKFVYAWRMWESKRSNTFGH